MASMLEQLAEITAVHDSMAAVHRECAAICIQPLMAEQADRLRTLAGARALTLAHAILHQPHCPEPAAPPVKGDPRQPEAGQCAASPASSPVE